MYTAVSLQMVGALPQADFFAEGSLLLLSLSILPCFDCMFNILAEVTQGIVILSQKRSYIVQRLLRSYCHGIHCKWTLAWASLGIWEARLNCLHVCFVPSMVSILHMFTQPTLPFCWHMFKSFSIIAIFLDCKG